MIQVEGLVKEYLIEHRRKGFIGTIHDLFDLQRVKKEALKEVDFSINQGEIVGFIGPNGAGKSTTIKILTGVLLPTSGSVLINGRVPWKERKAHVKQIGVMFGSRGTLWPELPAIEAFDLLSCMYDVDKNKYKQNLDYLTEMLEIGCLLNRPVRELSLGQRMRCELASVLIHLPGIVFLDEPTIGLDVHVKRRIRDLISFYNRQYGITFVYTSHSMHEVEEICPRLIILNEGQLVFDGKTENLKSRVNTTRKIKLKMKNENQLKQFNGFLQSIKEAVGVFEVDRTNEEYCVIKFNSEQFNVPIFLSHIGKVNEWIQDIVIEDNDIEDIIVKVYEDSLANLKGA